MSDEGKRTGVDDALSLEGIYYTAQIPRNPAVLTIMGAVFDRVHFPGVYLPTSGFDQKDLDQEILRIAGLPDRGGLQDTATLISILRFIRHAPELEGFCVFAESSEVSLVGNRGVPEDMVKALYEAIHGPSPPNWEPMFEASSHKGLPGGDETVSYPGDYHYLAGAVLESAKTGLPLINDLPGTPVPGLEQSSPINDARLLSTMLAIECARVSLPTLPLLKPTDLMEFRAENTTTLRAFRRSMLRYAADLNRRLGGGSPADVEEATRFFVATEIVPALDELRGSLSKPASPWWKRSLNAVSVLPELATNFLTMTPETAIAKALIKYSGQLFSEIATAGDKRDAARRAGLYYLVRLQTHKLA